VEPDTVEAQCIAPPQYLAPQDLQADPPINPKINLALNRKTWHLLSGDLKLV